MTLFLTPPCKAQPGIPRVSQSVLRIRAEGVVKADQVTREQCVRVTLNVTAQQGR
jgi:hypothetical protein